MPITAVISNSDGIVHGTDNGKKTGCGIKYTAGDNLRKYKQGEVLTDLIIAMKTLNCEKCRRVLSSKMIKEDRKAENKREKEEQKRIAEAIKRGELDKDGNPIVKPEDSQENVSQEQETVSQSVQKADVQQEPVQPPVESKPYVAPIIYGQPSTPPIAQSTVNEDISQFIVEPNKQSTTQEYVAPTNSPKVDDDISQFMVNPSEIPSQEPTPVKRKPLDDINDILADLDALMSNVSIKNMKPINKEVQSVEEVSVPVINDFAPVEEVPTVEEVSVPVINDFAPVEEVPTVEEISAPVINDFAPVEEVPTVEEISAPVIDDFASVEEVPTVEEISAPVINDFAPVEEVPTVEEISAPVINDFAPVEEVPTVEEISAPVINDFAPVEEVPTVKKISAPVINDFAPVEEVPTVEEISAPVINDFAPVEEVPTVEEVSAPVKEVSKPVVETPVAPTPINPIQQPTGFNQPIFNGYQQPVSNIPQPTYVQPTPMPQTPIQPMPQYYYNAYGEAIPITYNAQNQPVFTVPVNYDSQGQPRPIQMNQPTMPIPQPYMQQPQPQTYVQPQSTVTQPTTTPPPTRVVRADAPPLISKPTQNKPFDFSIFENETKKPVFVASENKIFVDSIEEALNQLGVETEKNQEDSNDVAIEYQEYVAPTKSVPKPKPTKPVEKKPEISEAERKKREKIDAKLKKEWEKKGLDPNAWKRMKH